MGGKVWKGLDFRPVITKLLARLAKEPIQRKVDLAKILPKTSEVCLRQSSFSSDHYLNIFHRNHLMTTVLIPLTTLASGTASPSSYAPTTLSLPKWEPHSLAPRASHFPTTPHTSPNSTTVASASQSLPLWVSSSPVARPPAQAASSSLSAMAVYI